MPPFSSILTTVVPPILTTHSHHPFSPPLSPPSSRSGSPVSPPFFLHCTYVSKVTPEDGLRTPKYSLQQGNWPWAFVRHTGMKRTLRTRRLLIVPTLALSVALVGCSPVKSKPSTEALGAASIPATKAPKSPADGTATGASPKPAGDAKGGWIGGEPDWSGSAASGGAVDGDGGTGFRAY